MILVLGESTFGDIKLRFRGDVMTTLMILFILSNLFETIKKWQYLSLPVIGGNEFLMGFVIFHTFQFIQLNGG